jgi:rhodanese-related sulfurtransferase
MKRICMKKTFLGSIFLLIFFATAYSQKVDTVKYQSLEPYDFHLEYLKADTAMLVDVREPFEFRGRRIKDAVNMPSSGDLDFAADTIDKNYAMFFYCTTDYRSKRIAEIFVEKGFTKVYSLDGGIVAWKKNGFPVIRRKRKGK